jgi:hypothetical protein
VNPCAEYPDNAWYKTIGLGPCDVCGSTDCWAAYLKWEARACPDFHAARLRGELEEKP